MNAGLLGGLLLPILGALPDALLILVSGVGGSAQEVLLHNLSSLREIRLRLIQTIAFCLE